MEQMGVVIEMPLGTPWELFEDLRTALADKCSISSTIEDERFASVNDIASSLPSIFLAFGSAGAFTALYQVISKYLERHKEREISLERGGVKITIRAHSLPEERELLGKLFPELSETRAIED